MNGKFWGNVALCAVVLAGGMVAVSKISASSGIIELLVPPVQLSEFMQENKDTIELGGVRIRVRENDNLVDAVFAVDNRGEQDIRGIEILCSFYDADGTYQGRSKWATHDTVTAGNRGVFSFTTEQYMGKAVVSSDCQITGAEIAKAPLITVHRGTVGHDTDAGADAGGH
ncbi:MAG: hypothetical protein H8E79_06290 [Desulfobulbaceae bacterium]|uniref:Uncharacterized protein n=1 Tax=Candidatus Desulfatifera sulfidica TaxID=2841691 RepID=A0A8J6N6R9_9BACT|nr:hypothetical protein [Candidatus Desulfatifera sulfidica]